MAKLSEQEKALLAKAKSAFVTKSSINDSVIMKSVSSNISKINQSNMEEIHSNLMTTLSIKNESDSNYFYLNNFINLVEEIRIKKANVKRKMS